jgi:predicted RNase H-like HicB family nuclease
MKRTVEEYMALPYAIEITPDEGSFFVKIKELDGCISVGDNVADAVAMIEDAKRAWLTSALEDGIDIPLPESLQTDRYSGKFALRLPKSRHRQLAEAAEKDGVSLNQYIVTLLAERNSLAEVRRLLTEQIPAINELPEVETAMTFTTKSPNVLPFRRRMVGG